ncbi:unnamed protein product [Caenorhabditis brenneri]
MEPFEERLRPRQNPIFGEKMAGLKNLVLPPTTSAKSSVSTPKDPSFSAHETVFYAQAHGSLNLHHYNESRPSCAFSGNNGATSTPVAKNNHFFAGGIQEEEGDDSVFENSKKFTAMESPIQPPQQMKKAIDAQESQEAAEKERLRRENQARKAAEEAEKAEKLRLALEKQKKEVEQKRLETARINQEESKNGALPISQNPNRFGRALEKSPENAGLASTLKPAQSSTETDSKSPINTGSSLFRQRVTPAAIPTVSSLFGQKPAQNITGTKPATSSGSELYLIHPFCSYKFFVQVIARAGKRLLRREKKLAESEDEVGEAP